MNTVSIKATVSKSGNQYIIVPATNADRINLSIFSEENEKKFVSVTMKKSNANKSYTQLKTAWALITILFQTIYDRKPTEKERQEFYGELLEEYSDRKQSLLHEDRTVPISFSEMSKEQLSRFIQTLVNLLSDSCDLDFNTQVDVKDIFTEWQGYMSSQEEDWTDFDEDGNYLPIPEWRERHSVSFASGLGGPLDLAHIVSRGADEIHRDCCWNTMLLTHEEHMKQHQIGWNSFLQIYPHLRGRVDRARRIAGHLALLEED